MSKGGLLLHCNTDFVWRGRQSEFRRDSPFDFYFSIGGITAAIPELEALPPVIIRDYYIAQHCTLTFIVRLAIPTRLYFISLVEVLLCASQTILLFGDNGPN